MRVCVEHPVVEQYIPALQNPSVTMCMLMNYSRGPQARGGDGEGGDGFCCCGS